MSFSDDVQQVMDDAVNGNPIVLQLWRGEGVLGTESEELLRILAQSQNGLHAGITAIANKLNELV